MPYLAHGSQANDLHLVLAPHLPVHGVDSGALPHRPDVQGDNRECEIPDLVLCGPVYRWSRPVPSLVVVSDDGQAATGPPSAAEPDAGLAVGAGPASVTSESSNDTSTVSSVSTSSLSPTSLSSDSSDNDTVA